MMMTQKEKCDKFKVFLCWRTARL